MTKMRERETQTGPYQSGRPLQALAKAEGEEEGEGRSAARRRVRTSAVSTSKRDW
jgi:hypothetical protein